ncbi:MAG: hypothetical protein IJW70_03425 [Clostridia bacterium]|nr:hypothetical protein [Clostridia bacterium]
MKNCKLALLLFCLVLAMTLAACQTPETPPADTETSTEQGTEEPTPSADPNALESYTVYVSPEASVWERKCAEALIEALTEQTGVTLTLNRDAAARTDCEIIVGAATLDDALKAQFDYEKIGYNGYAVKRDGNKLILTANIENGMLSAVEYACTNAIADGKVAQSCEVLVEQDISTVTPDENKHINVTISGDTGYDIYQLPSILNSGYRYGASIIVNEDGTMDAWFASTGCGSTQWDWISYKHSEDGGKTWSEEKCVLQPTPDSLDHYSCCDPGVIYFNGYYYIGYTSTVNANMCDNCIFVARSENPDGPFEKWNGSGWGGDDPQPIVFFSEPQNLWGHGEISFVELNGTLYMYYTLSGAGGHSTQVSTANALDENWPATMEYRGIAVNGGTNDSLDVKYVEQYGKFLAICTDQRLSANSYLSFFESNDGITFEHVDIVKENVYHYCHNSGMAGTKNGHITPDTPTFAAYAYGKDWGVWNTRVQDFTLSLTDTIDLSEQNKDNIKADTARDKRDPATLEFVAISAREDDVLYVSTRSKGLTINLYACTTFQNEWTSLRKYKDELKMSSSNTDVATVEDGSLTVKIKGVGKAVITAEFRGLITQICVKVYDKNNATGAVTGFTPYVTDTYVIDQTSPLPYNPQIKSIISFDDATWIEGWSSDHGITYECDESKILVNAAGVVFPLEEGTHEITVKCGEFSYVAKVTVIAPEKVFTYENIDFTNAAASKVFGSANNASWKLTDEGLLCTATTGEDPLIYISYLAGGIKTDKYKSVTLTYKLEPGASKTTGQMFFMTDASPDPAEASSSKYPMVADGQWHTVTIDLAGKSFWSGTLNQIRFDFFDNCQAGETILIQSIALDPIE